MCETHTIRIETDSDIIIARRLGREIASQLRLSIADQTRFATAISELVRNVLKYAREGVCTITDLSDLETCRMRVVVEDHGPGILNIEQAMTDGYSTSGGLGAGLPGTKRLMDRFFIESKPGHTRVTIEMIRRRQ